MGTLLNRRRYMGGGAEEIIVPVEDYGYLATTALKPTSFTFNVASEISTNDIESISYSLDDGTTWVTVNNVDNTAVTVTTPTVSAYNHVLWKGNGKAWQRWRTSRSLSIYSYFSSDDIFSISGNPLSMAYGDSYTSATVTKDWLSMARMFYQSKVYSASNLNLDFNISPGTFAEMFRECTELRFPPPELSHESSGGSPGTFGGMFYGCSKLTSAPVINIATLKQNSCSSMFYECSSLKEVTIMCTDISASNCLNNWLYGVPATGTITIVQGITFPTGASGIPSGWAVVEIPTT